MPFGNPFGTLCVRGWKIHFPKYKKEVLFGMIEIEKPNITTANLSQDAGACTLPLESFKSTFQGLIFANTNFHHFPSPLTAT